MSSPFSRLALLYGEEAVALWQRARVLVLGVGGVGSFAAEALARSAIGSLTLGDFDRIAESNLNRQLPALSTNIGEFKAQVLQERLQAINPQATVQVNLLPYRAEQPNAYDLASYDAVLDCLDDLPAKAHLVQELRNFKGAWISSLGAGGKRDPLAIEVGNLAQTSLCPLARALRKRLRREYGLSLGELREIPVVFSKEPVHKWSTVVGEPLLKKIYYGTTVCVTGTFGLVCANYVLNKLLATGEKSCLHQL